VAAIAGVVAILGGLSTVQEWAENLGLPVWGVVVLAAALLTSVLHVAQWLAWREAVQRLAEVERRRETLPEPDRERLLELKAVAGQAAEVGTSRNPRLEPSFSVAPSNLIRLGHLGGWLRHYGKVNRECRELRHHLGIIVGAYAPDRWPVVPPPTTEQLKKAGPAAEETYRRLIEACDELLAR
jgi:hypothetical protein